MSLKLCSINCNGLSRAVRSNYILNRCHQLNFDIIFFQETHFQFNHESRKTFKGQGFTGKLYTSNGTRNSRGVAIYLNNFLNYSVKNITKDFEGRLISLDIDIGENKWRLINVYVPNVPADRNTFLNNLSNYLVTTRDIILGGDFNFVEDRRLDRLGGVSNRADNGIVAIQNLKKDFFLVDAFRILYKNKKEYTFRKADFHARLDRFYISQSLAKWIEKIKVHLRGYLITIL